jgi:hypothetical protein
MNKTKNTLELIELVVANLWYKIGKKHQCSVLYF